MEQIHRRIILPDDAYIGEEQLTREKEIDNIEDINSAARRRL